MKPSFKTIAVAAAFVAVSALAAPTLFGQGKPPSPPARGGQPAPPLGGKSTERTFKVKLDFNRWHDTAELAADLRTLEKAFPKFLKLVVARQEPRRARPHAA